MAVSTKWAWAACRCPRCHEKHTDLVPAITEAARKDKGGRPHCVICDRCYLVTHGSAAAEAYATIRKALGGEQCGT